MRKQFSLEGFTFDDVLLIPQFSSVFTRMDVNTESYLCFEESSVGMECIKLKSPIISANMDSITESAMAIKMALLGGVGVIHRYLSTKEQLNEVFKVKEVCKEEIESYPDATLNSKGELIVGAAVGIKNEDYYRVDQLVEGGVDFIVVDVAHGHFDGVGMMVDLTKKAYPHIPLVAGNVATSDGAKYLFDKGADVVKVGIGSGSICSTRIITGSGVPQLTAIMNCSEVARNYGKTIIADGGIRTPGDFSKAIAIGANCVMLGSVLSGTKETPGEVKNIDGREYKTYRGMASREASMNRPGYDKKEKTTPEGIDTNVPYKGPVDNVIDYMMGGLRSGMSYSGCRTVADFMIQSKFMRITDSGKKESHPHILDT